MPPLRLPPVGNQGAIVALPIGSMYGIFTYIWWIFMVNVGKYTIHGYYMGCSLNFLFTAWIRFFRASISDRILFSKRSISPHIFFGVSGLSPEPLNTPLVPVW